MAEIYRPTQRQNETADIFRQSNLFRTLVDCGYSLNITELANGYSKSDLPLTYVNRNPSGRISLMVATQRPIEEIREIEGYLDQSPDVLAQWSRKHTGKVGETILEREELEEIQEGVFVKRTYEDVRRFGSLDGRLTRLLILTQNRQTKVEGAPDKISYQVEGYEINDQNEWVHTNLKTATTLLDGVEKIFGQVGRTELVPPRTRSFELDSLKVILPPSPGKPTMEKSWAFIKRACAKRGLRWVNEGDLLWAVSYRKDKSGKTVVNVMYKWDRDGRLVSITDCNLEPTGHIEDAYKGISHIVANYRYDTEGRLVEDERLFIKTDGTESQYGGNKYHYKEGSDKFETEFDLPPATEPIVDVTLAKAA